MSPHVLIFWLLIPCTWLAARRWGGWPERTVATMYVVAAVATTLLRSSWHGRYQHVEPGIWLVDVLLLCALGYVVVRSRRWWPIWSFALQAISTLSHVGKALNPHLMPVGYAIMSGASSYPTQLVLIVGIIAEARRRARSRSSISPGSSIAVPVQRRAGPPGS